LRLLPPLPVTLSFPLSSIQYRVLEVSSNARSDQSNQPSFFLEVMYLYEISVKNLFPFPEAEFCLRLTAYSAFNYEVSELSQW